MALAEEYGRVAAERWATAAHPDRAAKAIATNSVWVTEFGSKVVGWVEVSGATIESLYVSPAAARLGVGSSLLTHAERQIRDAGASIAYLDASPNAEAFYARRGYRRVGEVKANNSIPMSKRLDLSAGQQAVAADAGPVGFQPSGSRRVVARAAERQALGGRQTR